MVVLHYLNEKKISSNDFLYPNFCFYLIYKMSHQQQKNACKLAAKNIFTITVFKSSLSRDFILFLKLFFKWVDGWFVGWFGCIKNKEKGQKCN
jgi:hypothetical protein